MHVELTDRGSLLIPADVFAACFGGSPSALVAVRGGELWVVALADGAVGGLIVKQRNLRGDRAMLVSEQLDGTEWQPGTREAVWDAGERALRLPLGIPAEARA